MSSISDSTAAGYSNANVRSELATNAIRDAADQEGAVVTQLEEAEASNQEIVRENRKIPGLGNAVDISA